MNNFHLIEFLFVILTFVLNFVQTLPQQNIAALARAQQQQIPGLNSLLLAPRATKKNADISTACFMDYISESTRISKRYGDDYNICLQNATTARRAIDDYMLKNREFIEMVAEGVCMRLRRCNQQNNTLTMLHCHENLGADNTKSTYVIAGNASEFATLLQERYRLIDLQHDQCCHAAERFYVSVTAKNYKQLHDCLQQEQAINTTTSTATTPTTSTATTPTPTTSLIEIVTTQNITAAATTNLTTLAPPAPATEPADPLTNDDTDVENITQTAEEAVAAASNGETTAMAEALIAPTEQSETTGWQRRISQLFGFI